MDITSFVLGLQKGKSMGGSGGGSLPDGVYFSHATNLKASSDRPYIFELNGVKYCIVNNTSSNMTYTFYKWENNEWVIALDTFLGSSYADFNPFGGYSGRIEYNGKYHFFGSEKSSHYVFDGTTITRMADLPYTNYNDAVAVFNGNLLIPLMSSGYNGGYLHQWNEATDTWTKIGSEQVGRLFVVNGELYGWDTALTDSANFVKYENGTFTTVMPNPYKQTQYIKVYNGFVYLLGNSPTVNSSYNYKQIWKVDLNNLTSKCVGELITSSSSLTRKTVLSHSTTESISRRPPLAS